VPGRVERQKVNGEWGPLNGRDGPCDRPGQSMCCIYARESKQRVARVLFWQTRHFIQAAEAALFDSITPFRSAALVIFNVLAECADDALFATDSGFEFLVQASESLWSFPWKASSMVLVRSDRVCRLSCNSCWRFAYSGH